MIPAFKNQHIDPRNWPTSAKGTWTAEIMSDAIARTPALGQSFFLRLFAAHPELERDVLFMRWSVQDEDTYAFFDRPEGAFGVQFDPCLAYIIVFGADGNNEIGEWFDDPVAEALRHIDAEYLSKHST
jgi:hypothetical protein